MGHQTLTQYTTTIEEFDGWVAPPAHWGAPTQGRLLFFGLERNKKLLLFGFESTELGAVPVRADGFAVPTYLVKRLGASAVVVHFRTDGLFCVTSPTWKAGIPWREAERARGDREHLQKLQRTLASKYEDRD